MAMLSGLTERCTFLLRRLDHGSTETMDQASWGVCA